ncbi:hypothetical protein GMORB2_2686 [Geosmithia morbida]|uniref:Inositol polyphosphate-related phosphatase domain-containing protein n=1 Tax=Geosmithia morbida TaxID=1094350 RepID=A0A9P4YPD8_9HYPO|nr:uncharacterized protein GMORB2_2686 [Geosmithia morbida]KAF4120683.1 hypothetical protein GMORB2_2686 [Geosmithia morbida]
MEPPDPEGPDASSLGPVSSIRARFETFGNAPPPPSAPNPRAVTQKTPSRSISPAPKPNRLRDFKPPASVAAPAPTTPAIPTVPLRPKDRPKPAVPAPTSSTSSHDSADNSTTATAPSAPSAAAAAAAAVAAPPLPLHPSTRPAPSSKPSLPSNSQTAPSVNILPPQSPPRRNAGLVASPVAMSPADHGLNLGPAGASTPAKSPLRSTSPTILPPRYPRHAAAPSPPPPRRSGEIRREPKQPPPPPAPRRDKTLTLEPPAETHGDGPLMPQKGPQPDHGNSPFSSPPGSPGAGADDRGNDPPPPQLPTRPRPPADAHAPQPVRHSLSTKRNGPGTNASAGNGHAAPKVDDGYAGTPTKSHPHGSAAARPLSVQYPASTPPRAVRPVSMMPPHHPGTQAQSVSPPKRASSNPLAQQQPSATPARSRQQAATERATVHAGEVHAQAVASAKAETTAQAQPPPVKTEAPWQVAAYPDCSSTNRRPPYMKKSACDIATRYDPRIFDVCGELVCTSGQLTRVWNLLDGEMTMSLSHTEGVKVTSVAFKPGIDVMQEGTAVWLGTNTGELMEVDLTMHTITPGRGSAHQKRPVIRIFRYYNQLWTLDDAGVLLAWGPDETGLPNVTGFPHQSFKVPRDHTFVMPIGHELWHATGKEIRVFAPTLDGRSQFQVLIRPLVADGAGDVTSGTTVKTQPGKVFFGHSDGKVSIFSAETYACIGVLNVSTWKVNSLVGVGHRIWVGFNTGKMCVYDIGDAPWTVLKEWQAHSNPIIGIKSDPAAAYKTGRVQVVSMGADNKIRTWDGLLEDDWVEDDMKSKDVSYCDFDEIRALVFTWNAGASTPHSLRYSGNDGGFFPDLIQSSGAPDILIFGFQELVDLEDKTATAKRFLKGKKKESHDQESMSHKYRDWKDFLMKTLDDYMPAGELYHLLHTAPMVGLFTCVFVKSTLRDRIRNVSGAEVKRGMGGLHGNKGAVAVRFQIDDTSLCFVNCHLAAGQSQANARHNDVGEILEASLFPAEPDPAARIDSLSGGGDGSLVVDHELCILNGDLNYRIDTMSRDTVVGAVKQGNLAKLLERDQLLVARRRNPTFRLRAFDEMPITFPPTYKYDVGTDQYDSSEKKRSPAWCDRILYRGRGRVQQLDYRRHEVYVSDHRPVTGTFRLWVKRVRARDRAVAWMESQQSFEDVRLRETAREELDYLMTVIGYDEATSRQLMKDK